MKKIYALLSCVIWASCNTFANSDMNHKGTAQYLNIQLDKKVINVQNCDKVTSLQLDFPCNIYFEQGKTASIKMNVPPNLMDKFTHSINENNFQIKRKSNNNKQSEEKIDIYIVLPTLEKITSNSVANIFFENKVTLEKLVILSTGVTNFSMPHLIAKNVNFTNSGVTNIKMNVSQCKNFKCTNSGVYSGDCSIKGGTIITIYNSGVGKIPLTIECEELYITNTGVGTIKVKGIADKMNINTQGVAKTDTSQLNKDIQ